jgi:hypothetical protein
MKEHGQGNYSDERYMSLNNDERDKLSNFELVLHDLYEKVEIYL